eukprot:scaffold132087_cov30-Tisochrysis_lutea.AAC.3
MPALPFARLGGMPNREVSIASIRSTDPTSQAQRSSSESSGAKVSSVSQNTSDMPAVGGHVAETPPMTSFDAGTLIPRFISVKANKRAPNQPNLSTEESTVSAAHLISEGEMPSSVLSPLQFRQQPSVETLHTNPTPVLHVSSKYLSMSASLAGPHRQSRQHGEDDHTAANIAWAMRVSEDRLLKVIGNRGHLDAGLLSRLGFLLKERLCKVHNLQEEELGESAVDEAQAHLDDILYDVVQAGLESLAPPRPLSVVQAGLESLAPPPPLSISDQRHALGTGMPS